MLLSLLGDVGLSMTSGLSALGLSGVVWERSWELPLSWIHFSLELLFILSESWLRPRLAAEVDESQPPVLQGRRTGP